MAPRVRLPAPPTDLPSRKLPLVTLKSQLCRIHRSTQHWRYFGKNVSQRFDDPQARYGVLYGATSPDAAFAEVFLRHLSRMDIAEADLTVRALSFFTPKSLRCVDLTGPGLRRLSCDNRISTEKPYQNAQQWSRALYLHPQKPDGILYRSRHNPRFRCVALFDRCTGKLAHRNTEELMGPVWRAWVAARLFKYQIALT